MVFICLTSVLGIIYVDLREISTSYCPHICLGFISIWIDFFHSLEVLNLIKILLIMLPNTLTKLV